MLDGTTIFAGDSITVGLAPFVQVIGDKITVAKGGQSSAALLAMVRAEEAKGTFERAKNMVVLAGTNDIGGSLRPEAIFGNLKAIYIIARSHGIKVIALTIPPAIGYSGWNGRDTEVDIKRREVNRLITASPLADRILDSDAMMGSSGRLLPAFDSGDHIHPRKDKMGAAMNVELDRPVPTAALFSTALTGPGIDKVQVGIVGVGVLALGYFWWKGRK